MTNVTNIEIQIIKNVSLSDTISKIFLRFFSMAQLFTDGSPASKNNSSSGNNYVHTYVVKTPNQPHHEWYGGGRPTYLYPDSFY